MSSVKKILCVLALVTANLLHAQNLFVELDEELETPVINLVSDGVDVYAVSQKSGIGYRKADILVRRWNGLFWVDLTPINAENYVLTPEHKMAACFHQNELYLGASFKSSNDVLGITKWNGSQWVEVAGGINASWLIHDEISINSMLSFDNQLFVCGDFNLAGGVKVKNFVRLFNNQWEGIQSDNGIFNHLYSVNDTLYVSGKFTEIEGVKTTNLASYSNGNWTKVDHGFSQPLKAISEYQNELLVVAADGFYSKSNNQWDKLGDIDVQVLNVNDIVELNNTLYASGLFVTNGRDSIRLIALTMDHTEFILEENEVMSTLSKELYLQKLGGKLFVSGSFFQLKENLFKNIAVIKPGSSTLSGRVFIDNNDNCVFDNGDEPRKNAVVSLNNGSYYTSTNAEGFYSMFIPNSATSTIQIFPKENEKPNCNGAKRTVYTTASDSGLIENFSLQIDPETAKIKLNIGSETGFKVKHGYDGKYILSCSSADKSKFPITVRLQRDKRLKNYSISKKPDSISKRYISWSFANNSTVELTFHIDPYTIQMDDSLEFYVVASVEKSSEMETTGLTQIVVSAFDPNDKQCSKEEISTNEESLDYHIRFQNLGSDEATDVHIVDTIDAKHPIQFIQILKNSHFNQYSTAYKVRGHAIVWSFEDINLPAQQDAGDIESSGFVSYKCGLSDSLMVGQQIENKAYIYFDFQPPVVTNTTRSLVIKRINPVPNQVADFVVYPNPSSDVISVQSKNVNIQRVELIATNGKLVDKIIMSQPQEKVAIKINELSVGIYWVRIWHHWGVETLPIVVNK